MVAQLATTLSDREWQKESLVDEQILNEGQDWEKSWDDDWYRTLAETAQEGCNICGQPFNQDQAVVGDSDANLAHAECGTDNYRWSLLAPDSVKAIRNSLKG